MSNEENRPHLHVTFFEDTKENKRKSEKEGRPIFDRIEKVRIKFAGDKNSELVAPAHSQGQMRGDDGRKLTYAQQFPDHYNAFKEEREFIGSGTPISELPFLTKEKQAELRALNIHTAEALVGLDGPNLKVLGMYGRDLKTKAEAYLDNAAGSADVTRLASENAAMKDQLEEMRKQLQEVQQNTPQADTGPATELAAQSPFEEWDDETIITWIVEQGGEKPHHFSKRETLIKLADELNEKLKKAA